MIANINHQEIVFDHKQDITTEDILRVRRHATSVIFQHCTSISWAKIGQALAFMPYLQAITLLHCQVGDAFFEQLSESKTLLRLRIGTFSEEVEQCQVTEEGFNKLHKLRQLEELELGE